MESPAKEYVVRNCLTYAYDALRSKDRFVGETTTSPYESYFRELGDALTGGQKKLDTNVSNSEVESFYQGRISVGEFRLHCQKRLFSKVPGWEFAPFAAFIWEVCSTTPDHKQLCAKVSPGISQQVWEIFMWLDVDSQGKVHLEDLCDLIQRILRENGHSESEQNIREWFCEETMVDFWSFFAAIIENFAGLMKSKIIQQLHQLITTEILLSAKLTKKGHKRHSWKERWFQLQPTQLSYYESQESMVLKGTISIGTSSKFDFLPDSKSHFRRFKVVDSLTQVPYEICAPDAETLQQCSDGIKLAIVMNQVTGRNFLHRLTLAQKQVFPEHMHFSVSAITPSVTAAPSAPANTHRNLVGSKSVAVDYMVEKHLKPSSPPPFLPAKTTPASNSDELYNDPPPVPPQKFTESLAPRSVTPNPVQTRRAAHTDHGHDKFRRRHSSIIAHAEWEKQLEKEKEKVEHVEVGDVNYAVVSRVKKSSNPELQNRVDTPPLLLNRDTAPSKEVHRILPRTPSPKAPKKGYIELEFQNAAKTQVHGTPQAPLPRDVRTKWGYSTVVFEKDKEKEKAFEFASEEKRNKPAPPPPTPYGELAPEEKRNKPAPPPPTPYGEGKGKGLTKYTSESAVTNVTPQPAPRYKKPDSLPDLNDTRRRYNYADVDFTSPCSNVPLPNEVRKKRGGGGGGMRVPPVLPPKENSPLENGVGKKRVGGGGGAKPLPVLPLKDDTPNGNGVGKNRGGGGGGRGGMKVLPALPPKDDAPYENVAYDGTPVAKPRPLPRQNTPGEDNPPPVPARRTAGTPTPT